MDVVVVEVLVLLVQKVKVHQGSRVVMVVLAKQVALLVLQVIILLVGVVEEIMEPFNHQVVLEILVVKVVTQPEVLVQLVLVDMVWEVVVVLQMMEMVVMELLVLLF